MTLHFGYDAMRLWNTIETAFNNGYRPSMRRKAREWGVIYTIAKGEKDEDGDMEGQTPISE